ncbi:hypothetical protein [Amycolatopsis sp. H20-H5]|nr:hypothetical protein [Amycolatopsis sp. H20-H5]MEC3982808.1 hypothetical protein [Amycolatopsis sp. H20-H5]
MGDEKAIRRWWREDGARPRPDPEGWWPEADTLHWVRLPVSDEDPSAVK